jgi:hypothetical protein
MKRGLFTTLPGLRPKLLLCLAALATCAINSMAQSNVYSSNIVGYVNITQTCNFNIIGNPLTQTNNDVQYLFPNAASYPGLSIYKFNGVGYDIATYDPDAGGWTAAMQIPPGTGAWLQIPAASTYSNTFIGEVVLRSTNTIPTGFSLKSSVVPQAGSLAGMGIPLGPNDAVYFFNCVGYNIYAFDPDAGGWTPSEPVVAVAQGFWVQNNSGIAKSWIRNFSVAP